MRLVGSVALVRFGRKRPKPPPPRALRAGGGGELAAGVARWMLETGRPDGHERLARSRAQEFSRKWRFNRAVRTLIGSPLGVAAGSLGAGIVPAVMRRVIAYAGDVDARKCRDPGRSRG